ncbi:MAG: MerR family transcriptional regulator [Novosphingobium sp.]|nr:MerR family transcriptional regulator [Novosphingobium sp.]
MRTIGEVAGALGIRQHVLRYWEEQFPMLKPVKRSGGRRYYRPEDVRLIAAIDRLVHREGYTLRGARQALSRGKVGESSATLASGQQDISFSTDARERLVAIRRRLEAALKAA